MRVGMLSKEYPPEIYGGAGVHVEFLVRELRALPELAAPGAVQVHCFGGSRPESDVRSFEVPPQLVNANAALQTLATDVEIAAALEGLDVLHSHTWYANLAGVLGAQLHGVPHVLTAHSLEPQRPWKAEQLGGGYRISSWAERQAYESAEAVIAVSDGMRDDVLAAYPFVDPRRVHVIHNGIDTELYAPVEEDDLLSGFGIDASRPYAIFVGRITRQKGLSHFIRAAEQFAPEIQLVICAGAPDTPEIADEVESGVAALSAKRSGVVWVRDQVSRAELPQLLSHATVFVCPSIYEPLGIVNLEAMACETAVVGSAVGGIPEVVEDGVTGLLIPYSEVPAAEFEAGIAEAVNALCGDPQRAAAMGQAGRKRAITEFSWSTIARKTYELYTSLR
ncbi:MAG TPA: glycogen synthase [Jatrophihabitans sp.]